MTDGGGALAAAGGHGGGELTFAVVMSCLTAACGGLILGYDISITGGLTQMHSFLEKFFPEVVRKMARARHGEGAYCIFNNQVLTLFVSSLYFAGMVSYLSAGHITRKIGRRNSMLIGGLLFLAGAIVNVAAVHVSMLIIGRILLGAAVGFIGLSTSVYLAETAPARWRGAFTSGFHFFFVMGMFMADLINYGTNRITGWGWRLSLGVGVVPAVVVIVGAASIPDTPNSLVLRGKVDEASAALRRIRGPAADIDAELKDIVQAVERGRRYQLGAYPRLGRREYRPHLVLAVAMAVFFDMTGMIVVSIFTPQLFYTVGFTSQKAILGTIITDVVGLASIAVATFAVDRYGRRPLFFLGGAVMVASQVAMAWIFAAQLGTSGEKAMSRGHASAVVALVCAYTAGLSVSWAPLVWVITCEIFPLEVRSAALGINGAIRSVLPFVQAESFLPMLCSLKYGTFIYYAAWLFVMTAFVAAFLPETKGVPIESMGVVWARHWYWRRFVKPETETVPVGKADGPA